VDELVFEAELGVSSIAQDWKHLDWEGDVKVFAD